jgi:hypothetical protein
MLGRRKCTRGIVTGRSCGTWGNLRTDRGRPRQGRWSRGARGRFSAGGTSRFPQTPSTGPRPRTRAPRGTKKNSPSRFRFRPPFPLTFAFRLLPSDSVSTYLRSVLGASRNLTSRIGRSRDRKRSWPQFAEISFFNISTAFFAACGQVCGQDWRGVRGGDRGAARTRSRRAPTITHPPYSRR